MCSTTLVIASKSFTEDIFILNGMKQSWSTRLLTVLHTLQAQANDYIDEDTGHVIIKSNEWSSIHLHIISSNNFPTAAGLASSASGFACFTKALSILYNIKERFPNELTTYARQGSGSACRSIYGGWVAWWYGGKKDDGSDSTAEQIVDETYWPDIRVIILVASSKQKETGSTEGMQRTVETSDLLRYRCSDIVQSRMTDMIHAIKQRDFPRFAELTIRDSNQFHATCLDTYPPIFYLNDTSIDVIRLINVYNRMKHCTSAAYTFDAGPNAVIYCLKHDFYTLLYICQQYFGVDTPLHDPTNLHNDKDKHIDMDLVKSVLNELKSKPQHVSISEIILTKSGKGAECKGKRMTFQSAK